jgi:hypothetical protein
MPFGSVAVAVVAPVRRATLALGGLIERLDAVLRQWTAASLSLLTLVVLFAAAMLAAR